MNFSRVYDFDVNCGIAGCCIMQSNQAYFKFSEGTVARVKLQLVKTNDDGSSRDICLKQFAEDENPGKCAAHTVLINILAYHRDILNLIKCLQIIVSITF